MRRRKSSSASKNVASEAVLIAAFSGRALAQSARRAGYEPLVADAFGDLDTSEAAAAVRVIDGAMATGFRTKPLVSALDALSSSTRPIGLVLGSGFEDKPRLIAALGSRYRLIGNDAATYKVCKDPERFFAELKKLGIAHPATQSAPPANPDGWLTKRSAPVVIYNQRHTSGVRFPFDIPIEDFLFGFALVTAVLLLWERQRASR